MYIYWLSSSVLTLQFQTESPSITRKLEEKNIPGKHGIDTDIKALFLISELSFCFLWEVWNMQREEADLLRVTDWLRIIPKVLRRRAFR